MNASTMMFDPGTACDERFPSDARDDAPVGLLIDERDWLLPGEMPDEPAWGHDVFTSGASHDAGVVAFERATVEARQALAAQYALIGQVLADAAACPDAWCNPDPTADPAWVDPRGRSAAAVRAERREMAVRAAVCDLALRAHLSETTIRARGTVASVLRRRCPRMWVAFCSGDVDEHNAATAASIAQTLPDDGTGWGEYDAALHGTAGRLAPTRFRTRARVVRERVHPRSVDERHARARDERGAWVDPAADGMAYLQVLGSAVDVHAAYARAEQLAQSLRSHGDERRTLAQLRSDVMLDLLQRGCAAQTPDGASGTPSVAITVPVLSLMGSSDEPAVLDGYGPIDVDTARRLAGDADSWVRVLTHPVTGTVLDLDRTVYRVPTALRRWLGARDVACTFPGCGRRAADCDIDHGVEWQHGGPTAAWNLGPLCRHHHRVKTETRWWADAGPAAGSDGAAGPGAGAASGSRRVRWTSPTGAETDQDPPPW